MHNIYNHLSPPLVYRAWDLRFVFNKNGYRFSAGCTWESADMKCLPMFTPCILPRSDHCALVCVPRIRWRHCVGILSLDDDKSTTHSYKPLCLHYKQQGDDSTFCGLKIYVAALVIKASSISSTANNPVGFGIQRKSTTVARNNLNCQRCHNKELYSNQ